MTRSLVTGATGFLGGHLVRHLAGLGHDVHVLHRVGSSDAALAELARQGVSVHRFASHDEIAQLVSFVEADVIYHLATHYLRDHGPDDVSALLDANIGLGTRILESVVGTSTVVVSAMSYFQFLNGLPHPFSLYSATKQAFFDISDFYRSGRKVDVRQVVFYDTYGPGDTRDKLIPRLIGAARTEGTMTLGSPAQRLNLLYSEDVVTGLVAAAATGGQPVMTLRSSQTDSIGEITAIIDEILGTTVNAMFNADAPVSDLVDTSGDWPTPAGWRPRFDLRAGLLATIADSSVQ